MNTDTPLIGSLVSLIKRPSGERAASYRYPIRRVLAGVAVVLVSALAIWFSVVRTSSAAQSHFDEGRAYEPGSDQALAEYTQAIELDRNYADAYYARGKTYFDRNDLDAAISDFNQVIRINAKYPKIYSARGMALRQKQELDKALADFTTAIQLDSSDADAYFGRGAIELVRNNFNSAISDLTRVIRINARYPGAYTLRGFANHNLGNSAAAETDFELALNADFSDTDAHYGLCRTRAEHETAATYDTGIECQLGHSSKWSPGQPFQLIYPRK